MKYGTTESTFNKQKQKQILFITLHQQNYVIFFSGMIAANIKVILVYILVYMNQQVLKLYRKFMYACANFMWH